MVKTRDNFSKTSYTQRLISPIGLGERPEIAFSRSANEIQSYTIEVNNFLLRQERMSSFVLNDTDFLKTIIHNLWQLISFCPTAKLSLIKNIGI